MGNADTTPATEAAPAPVGGRPGRGPVWIVWHRLLVFVPLGAFATALVFDIWSQKNASPSTGGQFVYARGAYVAILFGLLGGLVASVSGVVDLARLDRASDAFRTGVRHLAAMDVVLVAYFASWLYRRSHGSVKPIPIWLLVAECLVGILLLVAVWLGTRLVYEHGVGVAPRGAADDRG